MMFTLMLFTILFTVVPYGIYRLFFIVVPEKNTVLFLFWGQLKRKITEPGFYFEFFKAWPGAQVLEVSMKIKGSKIENQVVHDRNGTMLIVDLWCEYRVIDAEKAALHIEDWEESFQTAVIHSALQVLCSLSYLSIIKLGEELTSNVTSLMRTELSHWGVELEALLIQNVQLTPEVTKPVFENLSAKLEVSKAAIEEDGRQKVQLLEAQTQKDVTALLMDAKAKKPLAIGRAMAELKTKPEVLAGYLELYKLQKINPRNTVAFSGFKDGEIKDLDAAMVHPSNLSIDASALVSQSTMAN